VTDNTEAAGQDQPPPGQGKAQPRAAPLPAPGEDVTSWFGSSGRLQAMSWLAEDFAAGFAAVASSLLRADLGVRLAGAAESFLSHFTRSLEELTCSYVLAPPRAPEADEGTTAICLEFSPSMAFAMIECLLGGSPTPSAVPDRPLTAAERRVLHRLADAAASCLARSWPGTPKPGLRADLKAALPPAAGGNQRVLVFTFELAVGERVGTMRLCAGKEAFGEADLPMRGGQLAAAPLELSAALEGITVDGRELADLAAGDIIATEISADGEVIVRIGGIPKFAARLGTSNGRKALTITRRLDQPADA
jgi:flagellar motor switch protein FliM